jgi:uncharacterized RDD family membrane protein YckC
MKLLRNSQKKKDVSHISGFSEWRVANPWTRFAAQLIDQSLVGFVVFSVLVTWFSQKIWTPRWWLTLILLWAFVSTTVQLIFVWFYKNTPGKRAMELHVQSARPHSRLSLFQVLTRSYIWWMGAFTLGSGWVTIFMRHDRRAWHDVAADTIVVSRKKEPAYPSELEIHIGEVWITMLATAFFTLLGSLVFVEVDKMGDYGFFETRKATAANFASLTDSTLPVGDQIQLIQDNLKTTSPGTKEYYELKTRWVNLLFQSNQFQFAKDLAVTEVKVAKDPPPNFVFLSCQAIALNGCSFSKNSPCLDIEFWKNWATGCDLKTIPPNFTSQAQALSYWWVQANKENNQSIDLTQWSQTKSQFIGTSVFEKDLNSALDFALSVKSSSPQDLMEKAKAITKENSLWGWAHKQALKEFGTQWSFLIEPHEKARFSQFELIQKKSNRNVASERERDPGPAQSHRE